MKSPNLLIVTNFHGHPSSAKKKKKKTDSGVQPMVRSQKKRQFTLSQISGIPGSLGVTVHLEKEISDMEILREASWPR